jgi:CRISPR system Cascade subunit CasA
MACFRVGSQGLVRVRFTEGRAFWRDPAGHGAHAGGGKGLSSQAAATLQFAVALHQAMGWTVPDQPLLVAGLASEKAKPLRWRSEFLTLPTALTADPDKAVELREQVALAERAPRRGPAGGGPAGGHLARPDQPGHPGPRPGPAGGRPFTASYYAAAQRALPALMQALADDRVEQALNAWQATLHDAALRAWDAVWRGLGRSPQALKADALFWPRLQGALKQHLPCHPSLATPEEA